nr:hypothetical protein GCM10025730_16550 [Promicromonospora thailandica]
MGKVLDDDGYGLESWIIAGMEWGAANADIVSMSLGDSSLNDGTDPMAQALNVLSEETGALFVVAAGNSYTEGSLGSPGTADAALTVGAVDDDDVRADFSSYGPRVGDHAIKPDLTAPGVGIVAARSQQSGGAGSYVSMNGTSMATPHVAGAAAIVKGRTRSSRGRSSRQRWSPRPRTSTPRRTRWARGASTCRRPSTAWTVRATGSSASTAGRTTATSPPRAPSPTPTRPTPT